MRTLTHDNEDDFFDDAEVGEMFVFIGLTFLAVQELAKKNDFKVEHMASNRAKISEKIEEYKPRRSYDSDLSTFAAINSISHSSFGGFGGFSHGGGFGGFGGGGFGGGGGRF